MMPSEVERETTVMKGCIDTIKTSNARQSSAVIQLKDEKRHILNTIKRYKEAIAEHKIGKAEP